MRRVKQFLAIALSISMLFSTEGLSLYASQNDSDPVVTDEVTTESTEVTETIENTESVATTEVTEIIEVVEDTEQIITTETTESTEPVVLSDEIEEETVQQTEKRANPPSGYIELPRESETPAVRYDLMEEDSRIQFYQSALEAKYVPETLPVVRNQGSYGTCWSFSSVALAELDLLQNEGISTDLSELHLAYFTYNSATEKDPLGGTSNDSNKICSGYDFAQVGGNLFFSSRALANWVGYTDETTVPYENIADAVNSGLSDELAYGSNTVHLKNVYYINILENPEIVKAMIKEYGGVGISYYADDYDYGYNEVNNCYYYGQETDSNHAVTVVGWDDSFSKENFNETYRPASDGAWLVRNSWGVDISDTDQYNLYGYFWLSYEETSIAETAYVFDVTAKGNDDYYDNNYQYDGSIFDAGVGFGTSSFTAANIFTAKSGADNEILKAVSFATIGANQKYAISVYRGLEDVKNPESGTLVATNEESCDYAGIYTVELNNPVSIAEGETFSVVVTITSVIDGASATINSEYPYDGYVISTTEAEAGQSLYKYGSTWFEYGTEKDSNTGQPRNRNFCIKAYTNDAQVVAVTGVAIENGDVELGLGEELQLTATIEPSTASNLNVTWKSSDESIVKVDKLGKVTGLAYGEAIITVTTEDGAYTDEITVKVTKKLTSISLSEQKMNIPLHETTTLTVSYNPEDTSSDKTIIWTSSAPSVASVDSNGIITAQSYGYCTITAIVAGKEAECTVYVVPPEPGLEVKALDDGTMELTLTESEGCSYYEIYRYNTATDEENYIGWFDESGTYVDDTVTKGVRYWYYVECMYYDDGYYAYNYSDLIAQSYQISYELGGGENAPNNPIGFAWDEDTFTLENPTHESAIFEGWYYDSSYKSKVGTINPYNTLKNIVVYAKWRVRTPIQLNWLAYNDIQDYTGSTFEPTVTVNNGTKALVEGTDYEISYVNKTVGDTNTCEVTVTGIGEYIGSQTVTVTERKATIQNGMVSEIPEMIFNGGALEPNPEVIFNGVALVKDVDYTLSYKNNTDIGTAIVTITGIGHFEGEVTRHFLIRTKSLETDFVAAIANQEYSGSEIKPNVVLTHNGVTLQKNVDYRISFSNNTEVGQATATIKGRGNYVGTIKVNFQIVGADLARLEENDEVNVLVSGSEETYTTLHTGRAIKPEVVVTLADGKELSSGKDYAVFYENNVEPGTATIKIFGKGNYAGTIEKTFEIRKHDIGDATITAGRNLTVQYTPAGQNPVPKVVYNNKRLVEGQDFEAVYYLLDASGLRAGSAQDKVTDAGKYELVLNGMGTFTGELAHAATITVKARALDGGNVVVENPYARIDGDTITAKYKVLFGGHFLTEETDYSVKEVVSEGQDYVTYVFEGMGNYSGTLTQKFRLIAADIIIFSEGKYSIAAIENQTYTGERICPMISVVSAADESVSLTEGVDYAVSYKYNLNVGTATVIVTGTGNCVGTMKTTFNIVPMSGADLIVDFDAAEFIYDTEVQRPEVVVLESSDMLKEGTDYTVAYVDADGNPVESVDVGEYQVKITLKGNYTGTIFRDYGIIARPVGELQISVPDYKYTGAAISPTIDDMTISLDGRKLSSTEKEGLEITSVKDNVEVSNTATVVISGSGNFTGEAECVFSIAQKSISDSDLTIYVGGKEITSNATGYEVEWTGNAIMPTVTISNGSETLMENEDYTLAYRYNTEVGTARIIVYGKNNYQGSRTLYFQIVGLTFSEEKGYEVSIEDEKYVYDGTKKQPDVTVTKDGVALEKGVDYSVSYANNVNAGTAKVTVSGIGRYSGSITKEFTISPKTIEEAKTIKTSNIVKQRYSGERIMPEITVEIDGVKLVKGQDYTTTVLNGVDAGIATLVVTGIGNYGGILVEKQFEIYYTTITYVMNGGVNSASNPSYYTAKDAITLVNPEPRDAYNFAGWYSDKACTRRVTGIKAGTNGNLTFYAKWTPKQVYGIDVSKWQNQANSSGTINWNSVKGAGKTFAMVRLSYGTTLDPYFEYNYSGARNAGVKVGVYCYNTATTVEAAIVQANYVVSKLGGRSLDYPVCLDMEGDTVGALDNTTRTNIVFAFKNIVEAAGYDFILYANKNWLDNYFVDERLAPLDLWIARYCDFNLGHRYTGPGNIRMWQYTSSGTVNGISGLVDLNICYEDYVKK